MRHARTVLACVGLVASAAALVPALTAPTAAAADRAGHGHHSGCSVHGRVLASGLEGALGSSLGRSHLYVTEPAAGRVSRIDLWTGRRSTFVSGLPANPEVGGGVNDVAFVDGRAYLLVTLVGEDVGGSDLVGVYRVDGPTTATPVADIGAFAIANPPETDFFVPSGVQFAMEPYRHDLLVTDGHHNRVLRVDLQGRLGSNVSEVVALDNVVPTGLELVGHTVLVSLAGPVPHLPEDGKVVAFSAYHPAVEEIAAGAPLLVDVEYSYAGRRLFALSQGRFTPGNPEGSPADPDTGSLQLVRRDGTMTPVFEGLDRPTSLELRDGRAYVVTLGGEVWTVHCHREHRHH